MKITERFYEGGEEKRFLLTPVMKLADLIEFDYGLLTVLSRLGIPLGFGEACVGDVCTRHGISVDLFLLICRIYSSGTSVFPLDRISADDLDAILRYLHASHLYYLRVTLPRLDAKMARMVDACEGVHRKILSRFFSDYRREVDNHFEYEERTVFPYVQALLGKREVGGYNILCFEDNHSDIDGKLSDLKSIVIKYLPESCPAELRNEVLFDIFRFEEDLCRHTIIENRVLIPLVEKLERHG